MIRQHLVRAFERGAWRDHRPSIELERGSSQVFHEPEDSRGWTGWGEYGTIRMSECVNRMGKQR